jgi:CRP/FNR family cyclic AMP-dependent transcriptional regulator
MRAVAEFPDLASKAIEFLTMRSPSFTLTADEASNVVSLMRIVHCAAGNALFRAGDENSGYMLLVLDGNVSVDTGNLAGGPKVDISVLGPSALIGELALLDGAPRSATCTAVTAVVAAGLSTGGFQRLMELHPLVAAKLAIYIARSASERLRSLSDQLQMYDQMTSTMHQEIEQLRLALKRNG